MAELKLISRRAGRVGRRMQGFTLVEMMVAMAIGLVLALAGSLSMLSVGRQFRIVGAVSAAQVNAQLALSLIDGAGRAAGAGLYSNGQLVCQGLNAYRSGVVVSDGAPLMPARIIDGGSDTASDQLVFTTSGAAGALSGMPVLDAMATADAAIVVSDAGLVSLNELAVVGVPGSAAVPCTLLQVTSAPTTGAACGGNASSCKTLVHASGAGNTYNAPAGSYTAEPRYGFATAGAVAGPAVVMRMGNSFVQDAFTVMCDTLVQYNAFSDAPACTASPLAYSGGANALVSDVVLMQAQYGISASAASDVVTSWVEPTGGTWANPVAADVSRIKAVRVVLVSRAKEADGTLVTTASCTNGNGVVNTGPCSFDDAEAPVIDLSATTVPTGRSWRNYRYRVHQAVIPLRNVIWSN